MGLLDPPARQPLQGSTRFVNPTQITTGSPIDFTVASNKKYLLQSFYLWNGRTDAQVGTCSVYVIPTGGTIGPSTRVMPARTLQSDELIVSDFDFFVLMPGDRLYADTTFAGMYFSAHGVELPA